MAHPEDRSGGHGLLLCGEPISWFLHPHEEFRSDVHGCGARLELRNSPVRKLMKRLNGTVTTIKVALAKKCCSEIIAFPGPGHRSLKTAGCMDVHTCKGTHSEVYGSMQVFGVSLKKAFGNIEISHDILNEIK